MARISQSVAAPDICQVLRKYHLSSACCDVVRVKIYCQAAKLSVGRTAVGCRIRRMETAVWTVLVLCLVSVGECLDTDLLLFLRDMLGGTMVVVSCWPTRVYLRRAGLLFQNTCTSIICTGHSRIFPCGNPTGRHHWLAGFLGDLPFPSPFQSDPAPYSSHFVLIGSQHLDVKSRPNLSTSLARSSSTHGRSCRQKAKSFRTRSQCVLGKNHVATCSWDNLLDGLSSTGQSMELMKGFSQSGLMTSVHDCAGHIPAPAPLQPVTFLLNLQSKHAAQLLRQVSSTPANLSFQPTAAVKGPRYPENLCCDRDDIPEFISHLSCQGQIGDLARPKNEVVLLKDCTRALSEREREHETSECRMSLPCHCAIMVPQIIRGVMCRCVSSQYWYHVSSPLGLALPRPHMTVICGIAEPRLIAENDADDMNLFSAPHRWLIVMSPAVNVGSYEPQSGASRTNFTVMGVVLLARVADTSPPEDYGLLKELLSLLSSMKVFVDSQVTVARRLEDGSFSLTEVYRMGLGQKAVVRTTGLWQRQSGLRTTELSLPARRTNLHKTLLKTSIVVRTRNSIHDCSLGNRHETAGNILLHWMPSYIEEHYNCRGLYPQIYPIFIHLVTLGNILICTACGNRAGRCRLVGGFSRGSPIYLAPSFRRCSIFTSIILIILIDSQGLAVKSHHWRQWNSAYHIVGSGTVPITLSAVEQCLSHWQQWNSAYHIGGSGTVPITLAAVEQCLSHWRRWNSAYHIGGSETVPITLAAAEQRLSHCRQWNSAYHIGSSGTVPITLAAVEQCLSHWRQRNSAYHIVGSGTVPITLAAVEQCLSHWRQRNSAYHIGESNTSCSESHTDCHQKRTGCFNSCLKGPCSVLERHKSGRSVNQGIVLVMNTIHHPVALERGHMVGVRETGCSAYRIARHLPRPCNRLKMRWSRPISLTAHNQSPCPNIKLLSCQHSMGRAATTVTRCARAWIRTGRTPRRACTGPGRRTTGREDRHTRRRAVAERATTSRETGPAVCDACTSVTGLDKKHSSTSEWGRPTGTTSTAPLAFDSSASCRRWCEEHQHRTEEWRRTVFSDESRFGLKAGNCFTSVWRRSGKCNNPARIRERHTSWKPGNSSGPAIRSQHIAAANRDTESCAQFPIRMLNAERITDNDTLNHLTDLHNKHIDTVSKLNYILLLHVINMMNASIEFNTVGTWGYLSNGSWNGMMGYLQRKESDIGGTALFFRANRLPIIEYIALTTPTSLLNMGDKNIIDHLDRHKLCMNMSRVTVFRVAFVFRQPPLSFVTNVFTLPFSQGVWLSSAGLVSVCAVALYCALNREAGQSPSRTGVAWSDVVLLSLGAICQQGQRRDRLTGVNMKRSSATYRNEQSETVLLECVMTLVISRARTTSPKSLTGANPLGNITALVEADEEQLCNARADETGDPRENPPTRGIVRPVNLRVTSLERPMRVIEVSMEQHGMKGRGNWRSLRKPADQWHRPARFLHTKTREGDRSSRYTNHGSTGEVGECSAVEESGLTRCARDDMVSDCPRLLGPGERHIGTHHSSLPVRGRAVPVHVVLWMHRGTAAVLHGLHQDTGGSPQQPAGGGRPRNRLQQVLLRGEFLDSRHSSFLEWVHPVRGFRGQVEPHRCGSVVRRLVSLRTAAGIIRAAVVVLLQLLYVVVLLYRVDCFNHMAATNLRGSERKLSVVERVGSSEVLHEMLCELLTEKPEEVTELLCGASVMLYGAMWCHANVDEEEGDEKVGEEEQTSSLPASEDCHSLALLCGARVRLPEVVLNHFPYKQPCPVPLLLQCGAGCGAEQGVVLGTGSGDGSPIFKMVLK
ncbi:hypothetical protein PR048_024354 [Dryococelus australis]|uniref:Uncharacterized protein n=1 Tax=Dryococelus australis TaxID=614101 RepID=A0ABQ9GND6_9NEOP|nr:hypothetical protein PR048_024354 [Dryococelus australis]